MVSWGRSKAPQCVAESCMSSNDILGLPHSHQHLGLQPTDISTLYLAGGFANYVNVENAIDIGFLPPVPQERIVKAGNAAIEGACELLLSISKRQALKKMIEKIDHVELETTEDFFDIFVEGCQFTPMPKLIGRGS